LDEQLVDEDDQLTRKQHQRTPEMAEAIGALLAEKGP
jgi:hypothetical protein